MSTGHEVAGRVSDAINAHNIDALRGLYAADARTRRPGWPREGGTEELLASYELDFACVPDIRFAPLATLSDDVYVATEIRITGTNTGPTCSATSARRCLATTSTRCRRPVGRSTCRRSSCMRSATAAWSPNASTGDCSSSSCRLASSAINERRRVQWGGRPTRAAASTRHRRRSRRSASPRPPSRCTPRTSESVAARSA